MIDRENAVAIAKSRNIRAVETSDGGLGGLVEPLRMFHMSEIQLERFAAAVARKAAEDERDACIKACERLASMAATNESGAYWMRMDCASAIRARGTASL